MTRTIPDDIWVRAEAIVATGDYESVIDVLRDALTMLEHYLEVIADMEARRCVSFEEFDADFRKRNNIPKAD